MLSLPHGEKLAAVELGSAVAQRPVFFQDLDILVCGDADGYVDFIRATAGSQRLLARYYIGQRVGAAWFYPYSDIYVSDGLIGVQTEDGTLFFFNPDSL